MKKIKLLIILILMPFKLNAAQIIPVAEDIEVKAKISSYGLNRIKIEGGKIEGFRVLDGDLTVTADKKKGEIFVNLPRKYSTKITGIYINSSSGATFKMLLIPRNVPDEQIFLVEQSVKDSELRVYDKYRDKIISFYKTLYLGKIVDDYKISYRKKRSSSKNFKVTRIASYKSEKANDFYGEIFEVKNKSKDIQLIEAKDFYQSGVRAVKLNSHILKPKETTKMYIISIKN